VPQSRSGASPAIHHATPVGIYPVQDAPKHTGTVRSVDARLVLGCTILVAVAAGAVALASGQDYRARSFVIRVPPDFAGERGLERARADDVLVRALALAGERGRDAAWLRERSSAELTSRQDLSFTVEASDRAQSVVLATAYANAFRREIPSRPALTTRAQGAREAQRTLGPLGWTLLGGAAGLWLGLALAIVRDGLQRTSTRSMVQGNGERASSTVP